MSLSYLQRLASRPSLIREEIQASDRVIVIDEIQKLPLLMDEVHDLIEERRIRFLLTGSSARRLKRSHTSLMAGRAKTMHLFPFVTAELPQWSLSHVLSTGLLPPVVTAEDPLEEISTYVGDYLREEIQAEGLARKIDNFSRFLTFAARTTTQILNFEKLARDAEVAPRTVRDYYRILEDTLVGNLLEPFQSTGKRKPIAHAKFYFFDVGIMNSLLGIEKVQENTNHN